MGRDLLRLNPQPHPDKVWGKPYQDILEGSWKAEPRQGEHDGLLTAELYFPF